MISDRWLMSDCRAKEFARNHHRLRCTGTVMAEGSIAAWRSPTPIPDAYDVLIIIKPSLSLPGIDFTQSTELNSNVGGVCTGDGAGLTANFTLEGNLTRVVLLLWSPHLDARLSSKNYDVLIAQQVHSSTKSDG